MSESSVIELFRRSVRDHGDSIALIGSRHSIRYRELAEQSRQCANRLSKAGIGPGDRVVVLIPMSIELYRWILGLFEVGAVILFVEPWMPLELLRDVLDRASPRALVAGGLGVLLAQKSPAFRSLPLRLTPRYGRLLGPLGWRGLPPGEPAPQRAALDVAPADDAVITFTTGSSGTPKGVVRSHALLTAQQRILSRSLRLSPDDVCLHVFANFILNNLAVGAASVIPRVRPSQPTRFSPSALYGQMVRSRVTSVICPPASLDRLVSWLEGLSRQVRSVRSIGTGGGPVSIELLERASRVFPSAELEVLYGSSEVEPVSHISLSELRTLEGDGACVGAPVADARVRLGEHGEVQVAGPHVSPRYFDDEVAMTDNKLVDPDGTVWHRMGDLARQDAHGRLWLTGRLHSLILSSTGPVLPMPLERAAEALDFVTAAAAVGLGPEGQQQVVLAVQTRGVSSADRAERLQQIASAVPAAHRIEIVAAIPRDRRHRSKIDYGELRRQLGAS